MGQRLPKPKSFAALIDLWGNIADFARETSQPYDRAKRWRALNNIKPKHWPKVKKAAAARGWSFVDDALLAELALAVETRRARERSRAARKAAA